VRVAEQRARPRLDRHLGTASTETADTFRLYVGYMLEGLGLPADGAAQGLADALRVAKPPYGLFSIAMPGAPAALARLRGRDLRLAVVSNSNGMVAEILGSVGLADGVDTIIDSGLVGVEKPNPKIFQKAAAAVGVQPDEAVLDREGVQAGVADRDCRLGREGADQALVLGIERDNGAPPVEGVDATRSSRRVASRRSRIKPSIPRFPLPSTSKIRRRSGVTILSFFQGSLSRKA
jgi:haloacid dehalogenase-like hydrolase